MNDRCFGNIPVPFPDENCYSLLCRYAVRSGQLSGSQVSMELFGHVQPLAGYVFKPFRIKDIRYWLGENEEASELLRYGESHSCYPYYAAFLGPVHAGRISECRMGSVLTPGQSKRINQECGFTRIHKTNLWYCPECVREDFSRNGETCWRRAPQMPGVAYCPVHGVKLRESGVSYQETNYQIIPATYAVIHLKEPRAETGNVYSERYIRLARDIAWLLDNGLSLVNNDRVRQIFKTASGKDIGTYLPCRISERNTRDSRFGDYLAGRILKECNQNRIDSTINRQMGMIFSIEDEFGSMEKFSEQ